LVGRIGLEPITN